MIITQRALPRRTFLRGVGATLALPFLDAMVPAASTLARAALQPVRRLGFIYIPNGANMAAWTPEGEAVDLTLSPTLSPLAPIREHVVVPTGLAHRQAEAWGDGNGEHSRASATWLNGIHPKRTEGADVRGRDHRGPDRGPGPGTGHAAAVTGDRAREQLRRGQLRQRLQLRVHQHHLLADTDDAEPDGAQPTGRLRAAVRRGRHRPGASGPICRRTAASWTRSARTCTGCSTGWAPNDQTRVSQYLDAVREIERRIQRAEAQSSESVLPEVLDRPVGIPEDFTEHARLMFDLQALAFQADITRVFTFLIGREQTSQSYPQIGVADPHHATSHHQMDPEKLTKYHKINTYHVSLLGEFLEKLHGITDGDGSLLDHSMVLYGGGISDGDQHSHIDLPLVLAGGGAGHLRGGRHLRYATDTPMTNLLLAMLDKAGVPGDQLGDSTGVLPLQAQPLSDV